LTIYDSIDLTIPPIEQDALFVTTHFVKTINQARGVCEGNDNKTELCSHGCNAGDYTWNGMKTGTCGVSGKYCNLSAWCPLEQENRPAEILSQVQNWSIFAKIDASFPAFGINFNNVKQGLVRNVNLFTVGEILDRANSSFAQTASKGAIVLANIYYKCNLDHSIDECEPSIHFERIDQSSFSSGFNFRYAIQNTDLSGFETRTLYKLMGIRIIFHVSGEAGRFNLVNLMIALGAGAALLGVSSLVCDFIMQYCLRSRHRYTARKYLPVNSKGEVMEEDEEAEKMSISDDPLENRPASLRAGESTPLLVDHERKKRADL